MIDRNNWIAAREFLRDHEREAKALRRAVRSERRKKGIMNRILQCVYDSLPGMSNPISGYMTELGNDVVTPMMTETAPEFRPRSPGRGFSDGNFLAQVLR